MPAASLHLLKVERKGGERGTEGVGEREREREKEMRCVSLLVWRREVGGQKEWVWRVQVENREIEAMIRVKQQPLKSWRTFRFQPISLLCIVL